MKKILTSLLIAAIIVTTFSIPTKVSASETTQTFTEFIKENTGKLNRKKAVTITIPSQFNYSWGTTYQLEADIVKASNKVKIIDMHSSNGRINKIDCLLLPTHKKVASELGTVNYLEYEQLNENAKLLYKLMLMLVSDACEGEQSHIYTITYSTFDEAKAVSTSLQSAYNAFRNDFPEARTATFKIRIKGADLILTVLPQEYYGTLEDAINAIKETESTVINYLNKKVKSYNSRYEAIMDVRAWLKSNADYDTEAVEYSAIHTKKELLKNYEYAYDAYGALIKHKAVCAGFSGAFKVAMDCLGIPCKCMVDNDVTHEWNQVQMEDGIWYDIDITGQTFDYDRQAYTKEKFTVISSPRDRYLQILNNREAEEFMGEQR